MQTNSPLSTALLEWSAIFARRTMRDFLGFAHQNNFSMPQINVLMRLYYRGPATIADLRQELYGSRAAASQMIDKLVDAGLVERVEALDDRRLKIVSLTAEGKSTVERGIAARRRWLQALTESFDPEQQAQFAEMISLMVAVAQELENKHSD